jgi:hypothetical protein
MCLKDAVDDEAVPEFKIRKGDRLYGTHVRYVQYKATESYIHVSISVRPRMLVNNTSSTLYALFTNVLGRSILSSINFIFFMHIFLRVKEVVEYVRRLCG